MKQHKKFRVGQKVKILPLATSVSVEKEDVGKIGEIVHIRDYVNYLTSGCGIEVQMEEICIARGRIPKWVVGYDMIELVSTKGQQLVFDFMYE